MGFWSSLFGNKPLSFDEARSLLDQADHLADLDNPLPAMEYMQSKMFKRIPKEIIGTGGPLHGRFLAILFKIKAKVEQAGATARTKVERNWENLPSVAMVPIGRSVDSQALINAVKMSNKDLLCLIPFGADLTPESSHRQIELSYEFADDPQLVLMILEFNGLILIRAAFFIEHANDIRAQTTKALLEGLVEQADRHGFTYKFVER